MAKRNQSLKNQCVFELTMDIIGGKWKGIIIHQLFKGTKRFAELKKFLPDITARMLTLQLRELEADKIVCRTVYAEVPPRVEYSLTDFGNALKPTFTEISAWGKSYAIKIKSEEAK